MPIRRSQFGLKGPLWASATVASCIPHSFQPSLLPRNFESFRLRGDKSENDVHVTFHSIQGRSLGWSYSGPRKSLPHTSKSPPLHQ